MSRSAQQRWRAETRRAYCHGRRKSFCHLINSCSPRVFLMQMRGQDDGWRLSQFSGMDLIQDCIGATNLSGSADCDEVLHFCYTVEFKMEFGEKWKVFQGVFIHSRFHSVICLNEIYLIIFCWYLQTAKILCMIFYHRYTDILPPVKL